MMNTAKKIKLLIVEKEIPGAEIARNIGVDRTAIYHVISGKSKSPRIRKAIAATFNIPVEDLWPIEAKRDKAA